MLAMLLYMLLFRYCLNVVLFVFVVVVFVGVVVVVITIIIVAAHVDNMVVMIDV